MWADAAWSSWPGASQWGLAVARSAQGGPTGGPDTSAALGIDWWVRRNTDAQEGDRSVSHHQGPRICTSGHETIRKDSSNQPVYQRTSQIPAEQFPGFSVVGMTWTLYCSTPFYQNIVWMMWAGILIGTVIIVVSDRTKGNLCKLPHHRIISDRLQRTTSTCSIVLTDISIPDV